MEFESHTLEKYWRKRFERYAQKYDEEAHISGWSDHGLNRRVITFERTLRSANLEPNALVLDLGCGAGTYCRLLAKKGYKVVGLDYSLETLKKAAKKIIGNRQIYLNNAEIYHLPFKDETFDAVVCIGVLQTLSGETEAIEEITKILKNGGILFLDGLNCLGINELLKSASIEMMTIFGLRDMAKDNLRTYSPFKVAKMLQKTGLNRARIIGTYILPKSLEFMENAFEKFKIFQLMDKIPFFSIYFARAFLLVACKSQ